MRCAQGRTRRPLQASARAYLPDRCVVEVHAVHPAGMRTHAHAGHEGTHSTARTVIDTCLREVSDAIRLARRGQRIGAWRRLALLTNPDTYRSFGHILTFTRLWEQASVARRLCCATPACRAATSEGLASHRLAPPVRECVPFFLLSSQAPAGRGLCRLGRPCACCANGGAGITERRGPRKPSERSGTGRES